MMKKLKVLAKSVLMLVGIDKMLHRASSLLFRHTGEGQYPVKIIIHWMLVYTSMAVTLLISGFIAPVYAESLQGPKLGQPASKKEIAQWDIGVMPDGEGLPKGKGKMSLTSDYPEQTIGTYWPYATTLFDMTRRSMPMQAPGTLSNDEVYAVTAYLLYLNRIIGEKDEMNAKTLSRVKMPNREGFINVFEQEKQR
jgi:cytochrome c